VNVLQLIDSLEAGGAERVAVNYANELSKVVSKSYLCTTRKEGILKAQISDGVGYLFLNKTRSLDMKAISKLSSFIRKNNIDIIHAHSSSFFLATLVKLSNRKLKIVWHDHYGNSEFLEKRPLRILKLCSKHFSLIICVNRILEDWLHAKLKHSNILYVPNFAVKNETQQLTKLHGEDNKRIICLANLRPQKDHHNLLKAFKTVVQKHASWSLHLVGKDFEDFYSQNLKNEIIELNLTNNVYLYNSRTDIEYILSQSTIGVLSSKSEGLPIALLEYGLNELPVVVTKVGECEKVIEEDANGLLVDSENHQQLSDALIKLINSESLRVSTSANFKAKVKKQYSAEAITNQVVDLYKNALNR